MTIRQGQFSLPERTAKSLAAMRSRNVRATNNQFECGVTNGVLIIGKFDGEFASRSSTYAGTGTVRYAW
jgi:hypothetical protein